MPYPYRGGRTAHPTLRLRLVWLSLCLLLLLLLFLPTYVGFARLASCVRFFINNERTQWKASARLGAGARQAQNEWILLDVGCTYVSGNKRRGAHFSDAYVHRLLPAFLHAAGHWSWAAGWSVYG